MALLNENTWLLWKVHAISIREIYNRDPFLNSDLVAHVVLPFPFVCLMWIVPSGRSLLQKYTSCKRSCTQIYQSWKFYITNWYNVAENFTFLSKHAR